MLHPVLPYSTRFWVQVKHADYSKVFAAWTRRLLPPDHLVRFVDTPTHRRTGTGDRREGTRDGPSCGPGGSGTAQLRLPELGEGEEQRERAVTSLEVAN